MLPPTPLVQPGLSGGWGVGSRKGRGFYNILKSVKLIKNVSHLVGNPEERKKAQKKQVCASVLPVPGWLKEAGPQDLERTPPPLSFVWKHV